MAIENLLIGEMVRETRTSLSHSPINVRLDSDGYSAHVSFFGRVRVGKNEADEYKYLVDSVSITKTDDVLPTSAEEVPAYTGCLYFQGREMQQVKTVTSTSNAVKYQITYAKSKESIQEKVAALLAMYGIDIDEVQGVVKGEEGPDINIYYDPLDSSSAEVTFERPYKNGINAERYVIQGDRVGYSRGMLCSNPRFSNFEEMPFILDAPELLSVIQNMKAVVSSKNNPN